MFDLPLFPLNTVLFPGTPLHLHIFEERYKQMVDRCVQEQVPFGVSLIQSGQEALGPLAVPRDVGCSANIIQIQRLEGGKANIIAVGQDRFRILSLDYQSYPYLVGRVEALPLATTAGTGLAGRTLALRRQVERFLGLLVKMGSSQFDLSQLPQSPSELAYVAAALLQISPSEKQRLLELEEMSDLVDQVHTIYRRELALLRVMSLHLDRDDETAFSRN